MTEETTALIEENRELKARNEQLERQLEEKQDEVNLLLRQISAVNNLRDE